MTVTKFEQAMSIKNFAQALRQSKRTTNMWTWHPKYNYGNNILERITRPLKRKYTDSLRPCPFCGNELPTLVINEYSEKEHFYHIECECGAMMTTNGGSLFSDKNKCIRAWNRRKG